MNKVCADHEGTKFKSVQLMIKYWLCDEYNKHNEKIIRKRIIGWGLEEGLGAKIHFCQKMYNLYINDNIYLKDIFKKNDKWYGNCKIDNEDTILSGYIINDIYGKYKKQLVNDYWEHHNFDGFVPTCPCCNKEYNSEKEMTEDHPVKSIDTYRSRINKHGYSIIDALNKPTKPEKKYCPCCNKEYTGLEEMAEDHPVKSIVVYKGRIIYGYSIIDALNKPVQKRTKNPICPCCNKEYNSEKEMVEDHPVKSINTYKGRIRNGYSIIDALNKPVQKRIPICPCCNKEYTGLEEMAKDHPVKSIVAYKHRIRKGYSIIDALNKPVQKRTKNPICPCCNKEYNSEKEMVEDHPVKSISTYRFRIGKGYSIIDALNKPVQKRTKNPICPCCNKEYNSEKEMVEDHYVSCRIFYRLKHNGYSLEIALGIIPIIKLNNYHIYNTFITDNLFLNKIIKKDNQLYCQCLLDGETVLLHKTIVEDICRKYNIERINKLRENGPEE